MLSICMNLSFGIRIDNKSHCNSTCGKSTGNQGDGGHAENGHNGDIVYNDHNEK